MLTETLITIAWTAAVTSLPWAIAYRSQTKWLREGWNRTVALHDDTKTKLAAEKVETENLAETCDMLRKANIRLMGENANLKAKSWMAQSRNDGKFGGKTMVLA